MNASGLRTLLSNRAELAGLSLDDLLLDRLQTYFGLLARWNLRINLTGFALDQPSAEAVDRLLIEPLLIAPALPHSVDVWFDLGSGGGSPAIPIQLSRPARNLVLVESRGRKAAFLREVAREMAIQEIDVEAARIEAVAASHRLAGAADLVTVRAVRPSDEVFGSIRALLRLGGHAALIGSRFESATPAGFQVVPSPVVVPAPMLLFSRT